jgi:glyoxalase family protein
MTPDPVAGLHHVTGISGPAQPNVDFYVGMLGLRFVKRTVNFDDPSTYHLYYGDDLGRPGTALTFFPWANAVRGRAGTGMTGAVAFTVPPGSIDFWMGRFADRALDFDAPAERFGERVLAFEDPDGLRLELIERALPEDLPGWRGADVPAEHTLRAFDAVTLALSNPEPTARLLANVFGYETTGNEDGRQRMVSPAGTYAERIDLVATSERGRAGAGTIHHIAFRARSDEEQAAWQDAVRAAGLHVTEVRDRQYFRSIYFREPGGVLFEIATDGPGFTLDEAPDALGSGLRLPPWFEDRREDIERRLPTLRTEGVGA